MLTVIIIIVVIIVVVVSIILIIIAIISAIIISAIIIIIIIKCPKTVQECKYAVISRCISLLLLLLWLSFLVIAIITIANFFLYYHWNNNYCYSCHHTDMTSYQNSKFFVCFCWFTFVLPTKKVFLRDHNGNKAIQLFCVIPVIAPRIFFWFLFHITV